jgi:hypothetical protein
MPPQEVKLQLEISSNQSIHPPLQPEPQINGQRHTTAAAQPEPVIRRTLGD